MKPIPAIVEAAHETVLAAVRKSFSELREAEVQVAKTEKRAEDARGAAEMRRRECGKALVEARKIWPSSRAMKGGARGPDGLTWLEYLEREGIAESTAYRYMELAGWTPSSVIDETETEPDRQPRESTRAQTPLAIVPEPVKFSRPGFDLRLGAWSTALAGVGTVDTLITDSPYSARTHEGSARGTRSDRAKADGLAPSYRPWTARDVDDFVRAWSPRVRGWMVVLSDDILIPHWRAAYESVGRLDFQPVPIVIQGMTCRMQGDGPSSWAVYTMVARPRTEDFAKWGTLPGAYVGGAGGGSENGRGKDLWVTDRIVRDYSREGDLVCDPLAGYGGTLISALDLGRRAVGSELEQAAFDEAMRRSKIPRDKPPNT